MTPLETRLKIVDQALERIEPDNPHSIGHEVGQRIDVIHITPPITVVDQIFDPADVQANMTGDALDVGDDVRGGRVAFHPQAILWRIDRTGVAHELLAILRLAGIRRAQIE